MTKETMFRDFNPTGLPEDFCVEAPSGVVRLGADGLPKDATDDTFSGPWGDSPSMDDYALRGRKLRGTIR